MVQAQVLDLLRRLSDELGLALVFVTHDLPIVAQTCTHAAVMYAGRIVEQGPTEALYHETRHPYTRMLWAATPDLDALEEVVSIPGVPPRLDAELEGCPFAPRCYLAAARCTAERPELLPVGDGHVSACHFASSVEVAA
jgi:peptide/nickel transport system ATP-binding protein